MVSRRPYHRLHVGPGAADRLREAHVLPLPDRPDGRGHQAGAGAADLREREAHQPAVLARRAQPVLHLRPGRLQRRLPPGPEQRGRPPHHEHRHRRERAHVPVACHDRRRQDRPDGLLGLRLPGVPRAGDGPRRGHGGPGARAARGPARPDASAHAAGPVQPRGLVPGGPGDGPRPGGHLQAARRREAVRLLAQPGLRGPAEPRRGDGQLRELHRGRRVGVLQRHAGQPRAGGGHPGPGNVQGHRRPGLLRQHVAPVELGRRRRAGSPTCWATTTTERTTPATSSGSTATGSSRRPPRGRWPTRSRPPAASSSPAA